MTIFISYSRRDSELVDQFIQQLEKHGFDAWVDREDIRGGAAWGAAISEGIRRCQAVIVVLSSRSTASDNVARELSLADQHKRPIIPVRFEASPLSAALEFQLAGLQIIEFSRRDFAHSVDVVVQALRGLPQVPLEQGRQPKSIQTQEAKQTGSRRPRGYWVLGIIAAIALAVTLHQMGVFDRRDRRTAVVPKRPNPPAGTPVPTTRPGAEPEIKVGPAAYKILSVKVDPNTQDNRTLRLSVRVTVDKDTRGLALGPNSFRVLVDRLVLPPTRYPRKMLSPRTVQDVDVEFVMPKTSNQVVLQVGAVRRETGEIPLDLNAWTR
jgi:hypothetical protein